MIREEIFEGNQRESLIKAGSSILARVIDDNLNSISLARGDMASAKAYSNLLEEAVKDALERPARYQEIGNQLCYDLGKQPGFQSMEHVLNDAYKHWQTNRIIGALAAIAMMNTDNNSIDLTVADAPANHR